MKALTIPALLILAGCSHYPELEGQSGTDQYGYSYTNTGKCLWRGFMCSVETTPSQANRNKELRQEERRLERAIERNRD